MTALAMMRKARRRSWREVAMLTAALAARLCAVVLLRAMPFGQVQRAGMRAVRMIVRVRCTPTVAAWAAATASVLLPVTNGCLVDALVAQWLLGCCGQATTLRFGVAEPASSTLRAHAWLESGGRIVVGASTADDYRPLL